MKLLYSLLIVIFLTSCGGGGDENNNITKEQLNQENLVLWKSKNTGFYSYSYSSSCTCPDKLINFTAPVKIDINDYKIDSIVQEKDNTIVSQKQGYLTVEQAFKVVSDAITRNVERIVVSYDNDLGYPTKINIDENLAGINDKKSYAISVLSIDGVVINKSATQLNKENLALWQSNSTGNYRYQFTRNYPLEANKKFDIVVLNNVIESTAPPVSENGTSRPVYLTVEQAFQDITDALNNNADTVMVSYDKTLGYPSEVNIEYPAIDRVEYSLSNLTLGTDKVIKTLKQLYTENIALWNSKSSGNYRYNFRLGCFCAPSVSEPVNVLVLNKVINSSIRVSDRVDITNENSFVITVEKAFSIILSGMTNNVDKLEVSYDSKLGYPTYIFINTSNELLDGQKTYNISNLVIDPAVLKNNQLKNYNENLTLWNSKSNGNYAHKFYRSCFCSPEMSPMVNIIVRNNVVESITRILDGVDVTNQQALYSVDQVFQKILDAINNNVFKLDVIYDKTLGYPVSVSIDRDQIIIDEELAYSITNLVLDSGKTTKSPIQLYTTNLKQWQSVSSGNYSYQYRNGGFLPPESRALVNIVVSNNAFSSIRLVSDGTDVIKYSANYRTVEQAFQRILEAINKKAFNISVEYDKILGYPRTVNIKLFEFSQDDSVIYSLSNLVIQ